jgi:purine-binding chemotaxis protein CheW
MPPEVPGSLYVIAIVAGQRVAVDAADVAAVVDLAQIVPVPLAPPNIRGICALRSHILTVVDLAGALGQPCEKISRRAIRMEIDGHHYAFVVASVEQVEPILEKIHPIDLSIGRGWAPAVTGRVQTESGTALLIEPRRLIHASAEMAQ